MRKQPTTREPVLEPLVLPELQDADATDLRAHDSYDGRRFTAEDVSGLDLTGVVLTECELLGLTAHETDLRAARVIESRIERLNAPVLTASRATVRDVEVIGSRIGALDVDDAQIRSTRVTGCKLDWVNLRSSQLEDVVFDSCTIGELDLTGATAARVAFVDCRADALALAHAHLADVDLRGLEMREIANIEGMRGATLDAMQATALAATFAGHLGIRVEG